MTHSRKRSAVRSFTEAEMLGDSGASRDLLGYGAHPPRAHWPGGARIAVSIVVNYEEGSERTPADGDLQAETLAEASYPVPAGEREWFTESSYEFGSRVGLWRLIDLLDEFGVRPTIFATALALRRNPQFCETVRDRDWSVVGHGYRWTPPCGLSPADEKAEITAALSEITGLTGRPVRGWYTRPPKTPETRRLLAQSGVLYDCDAVNDDLPYFSTVDGRPFLVVPYSLDVNDIRFWKGQFVTASHFAEYVCDAFDDLYEEGGRTPRLLSIGLHPRVIGKAGKLRGLRRVLEHIAQRDDVWIAGRDEVALHWCKAFASNDTWNFDASEGES